MNPAPEKKSRFRRTSVRVIKAYERVIILTLIAMLMVIIAIATFELGEMLVRDLASRDRVLLDVEEMFELFGLFLLVLIGIELLTTLKTFITDGVVHVEVVLEVALIAIAQKIVILETSRTGPLSMLGLAALILALALGFWLVRMARLRTRVARSAGGGTPGAPPDSRSTGAKGVAKLGGALAGPAAEGAGEGAGLGVAQQKGDLEDGELRVGQVHPTEISPDLVQQTGERDPLVLQAALQRPLAQRQRLGDRGLLGLPLTQPGGQQLADAGGQRGRAAKPGLQRVGMALQVGEEPRVR